MLGIEHIRILNLVPLRSDKGAGANYRLSQSPTRLIQLDCFSTTLGPGIAFDRMEQFQD